MQATSVELNTETEITAIRLRQGGVSYPLLYLCGFRTPDVRRHSVTKDTSLKNKRGHQGSDNSVVFLVSCPLANWTVFCDLCWISFGEDPLGLTYLLVLVLGFKIVSSGHMVWSCHLCLSYTPSYLGGACVFSFACRAV
jgi:hypothetical protein